MRLGALLVVFALSACLDAPPDSTEGAPGDGTPICSRFGPWDEPSLAPGLESVPGASPTVDADARLIVWETSGPDTDLAAATREGDDFALATSQVAELNTGDTERNPTLSADGNTIWFTRGEQPQPLLFVSHRDLPTESFPTAAQVDDLGVFPWAPDSWDQGGEIFFAVVAPPPNGLDLAHARCEEWQSCTYLGALVGLDAEMDDNDPAVRSDGLELIYVRAGTPTMATASRGSTEDDFEPGPPLGFVGYDPDLTADGAYLYFALDGFIYRTARPCLE